MHSNKATEPVDDSAAASERTAAKPSSIRGLWLSFYSLNFYREVAEKWRGMGAVYLLMVVIGCWVPYAVAAHYGITRIIEEVAIPIVQQIPPITIRNGNVSVPAEEPVFIRHPISGQTLAVIDTTVERESIEDTDADFLLTKTRLFMRRGQWETQSVRLVNVKDFYVDSALLASALRKAKNWFVMGAFPFAAAMSYGYRIVQALLYGLIGLGFSRLLGAGLGYRTTVRLSVAALTPVILINTAVEVTFLIVAPGDFVPFWWIFGFLVAMGYLFIGVAANTRKPDAATAE